MMKKSYQLASLLILLAGCTDDDANPDTTPETMTDGSGSTTPSHDGDHDTAPAADDSEADDNTSTDDPTAGTMSMDMDSDMDSDMDMDMDMDSDVSAIYSRIAGGRFAPLEGYGDKPAPGYALLSVGADKTTVSLQVNGLQPATAYPAHIHGLPCALQGGGHYKIDPTVADTLEANELWPAFTTDADGQATVEQTFDHVARADAMALVIHDPNADGAKMHCVDLQVEEEQLAALQGELHPFAAAEELDQSLTGRASITRGSDGTEVLLDIDGLTIGESYSAHVHALPCDVNNAGGHYKIDPSVEETLEDNELWPSIDASAASSVATVVFDHAARPDAQSVVVHRMIGDTAAKVACADLVSESPMPLINTGDAILLPMGMERTPELVAEGEMKRHLDATTSTEVQVAGLTPDTTYAIHVHNRPCDVAAGGGHYKLDPAVAETVEDNELWLNLTADEDGEGDFELEDHPHMPRAEAQAIVIHDEDGERLACIPLS